MCMPLAAQTAEQERVTPTTQGRLTPAGQEQQGNVTMRFADLRARVTRQVDAVRRNDMQVKALDCPVHACFQPLAPDKPLQEKGKCIFCLCDFIGGFSQRWMHLLDNTKTGGGAGYANETIQPCPFFDKNMKKGLLEDLKKLLDLAPQHRQHKTWAKCVETLQKVTADGRTVPGTGVSFCMPAPQPVRVPCVLRTLRCLICICVGRALRT